MKSPGPPASPRLRRLLLLAVGLLFLFSVPWYRDPARPTQLWWGLPDWVVVALLCYALAALLNALAWWITDLRDDDEGEGGGRP